MNGPLENIMFASGLRGGCSRECILTVQMILTNSDTTFVNFKPLKLWNNLAFRKMTGSILSANFLYDNEPNCMESRTETGMGCQVWVGYTVSRLSFDQQFYENYCILWIDIAQSCQSSMSRTLWFLMIFFSIQNIDLVKKSSLFTLSWLLNITLLMSQLRSNFLVDSLDLVQVS